MTKVWTTAIAKIESFKYLKFATDFSRILPEYLHVTPLKNVISNKQLKTKEKLNTSFINMKKIYEEFTGIDEVVAAQKRVLEAEEKFIHAQDLRRLASNKVAQMQQRLRNIHAELDRTKRGEEKFVYLITEELSLLKEEKQLAGEFEKYEREERERFSTLSSALKESQEKERMRNEKTKYWSIIGSILGTIVGVIGSSINNQFRMREFRSILQDAVTNNDNSSLELSLNNMLSKINEYTQRTTDVTSTQVLPSTHYYVPEEHIYQIAAVVGIILFAFYFMR